jgi:hypothetical protein
LFLLKFSYSSTTPRLKLNRMKPKMKRINLDLPLVPQSLKSFIEKAVMDERAMLSFIESPKNALTAAGIPIETKKLTRADCEQLIKVLGNLRNLVASGKLAKEFRFEEVFTTGHNVLFESGPTREETYCEKNFDHSTEGYSCETSKGSYVGRYLEFSNSGKYTRLTDDISAPLLSPGDLTAITISMQNKISSKF